MPLNHNHHSNNLSSFGSGLLDLDNSNNVYNGNSIMSFDWFDPNPSLMNHILTGLDFLFDLAYTAKFPHAALLDSMFNEDDFIEGDPLIFTGYEIDLSNVQFSGYLGNSNNSFSLNANEHFDVITHQNFPVIINPGAENNPSINWGFDIVLNSSGIEYIHQIIMDQKDTIFFGSDIRIEAQGDFYAEYMINGISSGMELMNMPTPVDGHYTGGIVNDIPNLSEIVDEQDLSIEDIGLNLQDISDGNDIFKEADLGNIQLYGVPENFGDLNSFDNDLSGVTLTFNQINGTNNLNLINGQHFEVMFNGTSGLELNLTAEGSEYIYNQVLRDLDGTAFEDFIFTVGGSLTIEASSSSSNARLYKEFDLDQHLYNNTINFTNDLQDQVANSLDLKTESEDIMETDLSTSDSFAQLKFNDPEGNLDYSQYNVDNISIHIQDQGEPQSYNLEPYQYIYSQNTNNGTWDFYFTQAGIDFIQDITDPNESNKTTVKITVSGGELTEPVDFKESFNILGVEQYELVSEIQTTNLLTDSGHFVEECLEDPAFASSGDTLFTITSKNLSDAGNFNPDNIDYNLYSITNLTLVNDDTGEVISLHNSPGFDFATTFSTHTGEHVLKVQLTNFGKNKLKDLIEPGETYSIQGESIEIYNSATGESISHDLNMTFAGAAELEMDIEAQGAFNMFFSPVPGFDPDDARDDDLVAGQSILEVTVSPLTGGHSAGGTLSVDLPDPFDPIFTLTNVNDSSDSFDLLMSDHVAYTSETDANGVVTYNFFLTNSGVDFINQKITNPDGVGEVYNLDFDLTSEYSYSFDVNGETKDITLSETVSFNKDVTDDSLDNDAPEVADDVTYYEDEDAINNSDSYQGNSTDDNDWGGELMFEIPQATDVNNDQITYVITSVTGPSGFPSGTPDVKIAGINPSTDSPMEDPNGTYFWLTKEQFQYLEANQDAEVVVTYKAIDEHGAESEEATATFNILGHDVIATNDSYSFDLTTQGGPQMLDILGNDEDTDGDNLHLNSLDLTSLTATNANGDDIDLSDVDTSQLLTIVDNQIQLDTTLLQSVIPAGETWSFSLNYTAYDNPDSNDIESDNATVSFEITGGTPKSIQLYSSEYGLELDDDEVGINDPDTPDDPHLELDGNLGTSGSIEIAKFKLEGYDLNDFGLLHSMLSIGGVAGSEAENIFPTNPLTISVSQDGILTVGIFKSNLDQVYNGNFDTDGDGWLRNIKLEVTDPDDPSISASKTFDIKLVDPEPQKSITLYSSEYGVDGVDEEEGSHDSTPDDPPLEIDGNMSSDGNIQIAEFRLQGYDLTNTNLMLSMISIDDSESDIPNVWPLGTPHYTPDLQYGIVKVFVHGSALDSIYNGNHDADGDGFLKGLKVKITDPDDPSISASKTFDIKLVDPEPQKSIELVNAYYAISDDTDADDDVIQDGTENKLILEGNNNADGIPVAKFSISGYQYNGATDEDTLNAYINDNFDLGGVQASDPDAVPPTVNIAYIATNALYDNSTDTITFELTIPGDQLSYIYDLSSNANLQQNYKVEDISDNEIESGTYFYGFKIAPKFEDVDNNSINADANIADWVFDVDLFDVADDSFIFDNHITIANVVVSDTSITIDPDNDLEVVNDDNLDQLSLKFKDNFDTAQFQNIGNPVSPSSKNCKPFLSILK
jgi:hypothetical protein